MGTSHLKSAQLTALGSTPYGDLGAAGFGAPARNSSVQGFVTTVASDAAGTTYQLCRIPTNCSVKSVKLAWAAQGAGKVQVGLYYSSAFADGGPLDGTPPADSTSPPTVVSGCVDFFASDVDLTSAAGWTDETFQNQANSGKYTPLLINEPIWQAAGLTSDPGGFFDVVATVHTTAITTGAAVLAAEVSFASQ